MAGSLEGRILAELRVAYGNRYHCPNSRRRAGEPECSPWFSFRWVSRPDEPGRIRVWVSCATAELDDEFDVSIAADGRLIGTEERVGWARPVLNRA